MRVAFLAILISACAPALVMSSDPVPYVTAPPPASAPPEIVPPPPPGGEPSGIWLTSGPFDDRRSYFALDLMLGMQAGVRGQVALWQTDNRALVAEAFYGGLVTKLGSSETIGGGARMLFRRGARDQVNSLIYGPGVNVFYQFDDHDVSTVIAPSLDVAWLRAIGDHGGWQLGLSVGAGIGVGDRPNGGATATPIISIFTGFRF